MSLNIEPTKYKLQSVLTSKEFNDSYWMLDAPNESTPSLIRAIYDKKQLSVGGYKSGIYKFADWLPIIRTLEGSSAPATYKSIGLAKELGLSNLWITFSGYNPAIGANMSTCSFKETEAYTVCARIKKDESRILVVASAGNTARAFARVCSDNNIALLLCVPEDNIDALWFNSPINDCVKLIAAKSGGDYFDAIHLSNIVVKDEKFLAEGGAKNVARRDGMSTTVLSAVSTIGKIPEFYFQAVGSGTGAIAAWEANLRFIEDGRYGSNKMRLMVSQNAPFLPMYMAWKKDSRELLPMDDVEARLEVEEIIAKVLSNRKPPYSVCGGLYDALKDSNGDVYSVHNDELQAASALFEKCENIDIHPASAVAVASLQQAVKDKTVCPDSLIMLNITGGGEKLMAKNNTLHYLKPNIVFDINPNEQEVLSKTKALFQY
ncbi:MAG: cysteate synthase [Bacteroidales bacterium]